MFSNNLTREISLKVGPVILEVLVKHYFDRLKGDAEKDGVEGNLKGDDVLFHEAFAIVKAFLNASTSHTIEELQAFSNTRTPSPPWTHVVRVLVPMSCCEEAATYLIKALGGEEVARRLVGGVKWWQVRGLDGVDSQWLTAKKDWREAKRRYKKQQQQQPNNNDTLSPTSADLPSSISADGESPTTSSAGAGYAKDGSEGEYEKNMDAMRCILYLHGGGYYFGSVDQERYSIQRFARKINGRVFAINYRLAPQYPFPCALHDALAAYLYLIRPPPGSAHQAVDPAHIIVSGDSAGGGLSLALLQVIRDSGLPAPAGGVLISPWCDLTHSFPSIHINTDTDIIPESGLSFHKPSLLWPPPSEELSSRVHASLRFRIRQAFRFDDPHRPNQESTFSEAQSDGPSQPIATTAPIDPERVVCQTKSGEVIEVNQQLQFYARNSMLLHPLISPVTAYLGGLPPLLFIAGDKEVLRDEIIYTAHRAAYPEKYPVSNQARELYPPLNGIEDKYKPTSVHLQVYDDSPHILPILFMFTNPAKFCFRAIASFSKLVTGLTPIPGLASNSSPAINSPQPPSITRSQTLFASFKTSSTSKRRPSLLINGSALTHDPQDMKNLEQSEDSTPVNGSETHRTIKRSLSAQISGVGTFRGLLRRPTSTVSVSVAATATTSGSLLPPPVDLANSDRNPSTVTQKSESISSSDVGGPRFQTSSEPALVPDRCAGEIAVYRDIKVIHSWECRMIRERVSTAGVTRLLEPESELDAFQMPSEHVATLRDNTVDRFLKVNSSYEKKFARTYKSVEKRRRHTLERAKVESIKKMGILRQSLHNARVRGAHESTNTLRDNVMASPGWGWAWALDEGEDPPPSSIVSRRDTEEARKLAEIADKAVLSADQTFSGNNLWAVVINFLTATPGKQTHTLHKRHGNPTRSHETVNELEGSSKRHHEGLSRIWKRHGTKKTQQQETAS